MKRKAVLELLKIHAQLYGLVHLAYTQIPSDTLEFEMLHEAHTHMNSIFKILRNQLSEE